eukprot:1217397-Rhodomonas_salina.2
MPHPGRTARQNHLPLPTRRQESTRRFPIAVSQARSAVLSFQTRREDGREVRIDSESRKTR